MDGGVALGPAAAMGSGPTLLLVWGREKVPPSTVLPWMGICRPTGGGVVKPPPQRRQRETKTGQGSECTRTTKGEVRDK